MLISWQILIFIGLGIVAAILITAFNRAEKRAGAALSAAQRAEFEDRYRNRSTRTDMPTRYAELARNTDRAQGARVGASLLFAIALLLYFL